MSVMRVASGPGGRTIADRPPGNSGASSPWLIAVAWILLPSIYAVCLVMHCCKA